VLHLEGIQPKTKYDLDVSQKGEGEGEGEGEGVTVLRCYVRIPLSSLRS
jgi:hypothetical protein